jgi:hypothetical protein
VWAELNKKQVHKKTCAPVLLRLYSYANVSLTVSRDALRAGRALAREPRTMVKINQARIPLVPKTTGMGAVRIATPTP